MQDGFDVLRQPAFVVAPRLLGCLIIRELDGQRLIGRIVETEAYDETDAASHSFRGKTPRTEVMFGPAGQLYVYFTYGMHYCCNIVTGQLGEGSAVLIRAVEPIQGMETIRHNRGDGVDVRQLTNGPAKFCKAFQIDSNLNGHSLAQPPLQLQIEPAVPTTRIQIATRVGIRQAPDTPWRFYLKDNTHVSVILKNS